MNAKLELLDLLQFARGAERDFAERMGDQVRDERGSPEQWAPKDELAHIGAWKAITAEVLAAAQAGESYTFHNDLDAKNEELYHQYDHLSWGSVLDTLHRHAEQLIARVDAMPEADLADANRFPWLAGRSLWSRALHNGFYHPLWHLALMVAGRGQHQRGRLLMVEVTRRMLALDESQRWQDQFRYNMACYHALAGDKERAIEGLSQCLVGSPELQEWSRQDDDLASIWEEPAYLALLDG